MSFSGYELSKTDIDFIKGFCHSAILSLNHDSMFILSSQCPENKQFFDLVMQLLDECYERSM